MWARNAAQAEALARQWRAEGIDAHAATDLPAAAGEADIVSCATLATEPVVHGRLAAPGSHLDLIGSFTPAMREADDACFGGGARLVVDTAEALQKSGELLGPMARGVFAAADVAGTLADLCSGRVPGRRDGDGRTVFKSVGTRAGRPGGGRAGVRAGRRRLRLTPARSPRPRPSGRSAARRWAPPHRAGRALPAHSA